MSQYSNTALSSSMVLVKSGPCQLTSYLIDNTQNSSDVWIHCHDSTDISSQATGATSAYKFMVSSNSTKEIGVSSGNTEDPDGIWAFVTGLTMKCVTGRDDTNGTAPTNAVSVYLQIKP